MEDILIHKVIAINLRKSLNYFNCIDINYYQYSNPSFDFIP